ncbi:MAG: peptidylprolyl isomerase, partial [Bacteroidetes bacterium]
SKNIKEEVKMKLLDIREKVRKGEDFEKFAKAVSDDLGTASRGGNLGWFGRGQLAPAYEGMCMNLRVGDIGEPVESEFGFHLIQLLDRRGNRFNSRHILLRPKPTEADLKATEHFLDSIRTRVMIDSIKFEKAVSLFSDDKQTKMNGGYLKDYETGSVQLTHEQIQDVTLFKVVDSMKVGNVTPPMPYRTDDGKDAVRLIYLKNRGTSHEPNLKDDYERIYLMAVDEEKAKQMDEWFIKHRSEVFIEIDPDYTNCKIVEMIRE